MPLTIQEFFFPKADAFLCSEFLGSHERDAPDA
jgi:hypothetical protein